MTTRREFTKSLAALAATSPLLRLTDLKPGRLGPIGVQLYTVRTAMARNVEQTLARVRSIGYREVEFAGYFGRTPAQLKAALGSNGLAAPACHLPLDAFTTRLGETLEAAERIGHKWLVFPGLDQEDHRPERYDQVADQLNAAGEAASRLGMRVGYHTHDVDFHPWDGGETPLGRLLQRLDPRHTDIELDLYWCVKGGSDPLSWLDRHPGRFPLVHVKDAGPAPEFAMSDVGAGAMDWRAIFAQRTRAGIKHYFVEHDQPVDPWASITASFRYLSHLSA